MAVDKEKKVKEPKSPKTPKKGKRSIVAFEATDGTLFRSAEQRDAYEARGDLNAARIAAAEYLTEKVSSVEGGAASEDRDFEFLLEEILRTDLLDKLLDASRRADKANTTT